VIVPAGGEARKSARGRAAGAALVECATLAAALKELGLGGAEAAAPRRGAWRPRGVAPVSRSDEEDEEEEDRYGRGDDEDAEADGRY
jgi:hypothetical protein